MRGTRLTLDVTRSVGSEEFFNAGWRLTTNDGGTLVLDELSVGYRMGDTSYCFAYRN